MEGVVEKARRVVPVPALAFDGHRIKLDKDVATLGRSADNGYVLDDPRVSRVHAELRREGGALIVTDLGSSSGTTLNREPLTGPTVIRHGDKVGFGPLTATVEAPAEVAVEEDATLVFAVPEVDTGPRLSPRQQQVLEHMAEGLTNAQIGDELGITERTVKAYAQELYDKLGVRNRAGAVAQGARLELL